MKHTKFVFYQMLAFSVPFNQTENDNLAASRKNEYRIIVSIYHVHLPPLTSRS